jgi:hypothetical protein
VIREDAGARRGRHEPRVEVHGAHRVVASVRHVEGIAQHGQTLGLGEARLVHLAVGEAGPVAPDADDLGARRVPLANGEFEHPGVAGVGDEQPVPVGEHHAARVAQDAGDRSGHGDGVPAGVERRPVQDPFGVVATYQRRHDRRHVLERELACLRAYEPAVGRDERDRGPRFDGVVAPGPELAVVDDRMFDAESVDGPTDVGRASLGGVLARMDPDDHELAGEARFQLPDTREHLQAVDSTVRPEVEQHELAAQVGESQRAIRADPVESVAELGCVHGEPVGSHGPFIPDRALRRQPGRVRAVDGNEHRSEDEPDEGRDDPHA